jgi:hypothetical protein
MSIWQKGFLWIEKGENWPLSILDSLLRTFKEHNTEMIPIDGKCMACLFLPFHPFCMADVNEQSWNSSPLSQDSISGNHCPSVWLMIHVHRLYWPLQRTKHWWLSDFSCIFSLISQTLSSVRLLMHFLILISHVNSAKGLWRTPCLPTFRHTSPML